MATTNGVKFYKHSITDERFKYYTLAHMEEAYPSGDYHVIGEIDFKHPPEEGKQVISQSGKMLFVKPIGFYENKNYKTEGFIPTDKEGEYVVLKKRSIFIFLFAFLLVGLLVIAGLFVWKMNQGPQLDPAVQDYVSDLRRSANLDDTQILVPGYSELLMEDGSDVVNTVLFNPEGNPCYFEFSIKGSDGAVYYQSGLVPPGTGVGPIRLNRKMNQGIYNVAISITTYDLNDYSEEFNGAEVETTIRVIK